MERRSLAARTRLEATTGPALASRLSQTGQEVERGDHAFSDERAGQFACGLRESGRTVDVAGTKRTSFQVTELVEHEERMVAGAGIVAVPDAILLFAVSRTDARIHVEHGTSRRTTTMDAVDPFAGEISERRKVPFRREPARLKAAHLARRSRCIRGRLGDLPVAVLQPTGIFYIGSSRRAPSDHQRQRQDCMAVEPRPLRQWRSVRPIGQLHLRSPLPGTIPRPSHPPALQLLPRLRPTDGALYRKRPDWVGGRRD
jgi:hypothetical protein